MKRWSRYTMFAVTMLTVLALSAMQVVPVLADDSAPPPTETPEVADPAAGEAVTPAEENSAPEAAPATDVAEAAPAATEAPAVEAPAVEEVVPTEQAPLATEVPAEAAATAPAAADEQPAAEPETPAEILAQVPEGTDVVVLDENGEALSLATQEAAEILYSGDPMWCPVGVTPGGAGCSDSYGTLNDLVADFTPTGNGVIWIQHSVDVMSGAVTLGTGGSWISAVNYSLTFKGGWSGTTGSSAINPLTPSTLDSQLIINDWTGAITLSDIVFSGVTTGTALTVTTAGNITATNVKVGKASGHNAGAGASLNNSSGTGNVTLTNSEFSYNDGGDGLSVLSNGTITLTNIDANSNGGGIGGVGAVLNNTGATTAKNVVLTNSIFSDNTNDGVVVLSRGAITASNLIANSNGGGWGAVLDNRAATTALGVTLTGSSQFKYNGSGLQVLSDGNLALNNLTATNNASGDGAQLNNTTSSFGSTVTLTGVNTFNNNTGGTGISVMSAGAILLNNVTANSNSLGALLDTLSASSVAKTVTLNGVNSFSQNSGGGLVINSTGAVTLNKVTASNNAGGGGVFVDNSWLSNSSPQNVTLLGYGTFNNNNGTGLQIYSYGTLALTNLTARYNYGGSGAVLNNCLASGPSCTTTAPKAVTLTGNNTFNNNTGGTGLEIASLGAITINNVVADNNGVYGAYLTNNWNGAVGGITVGNTATYWPSFSNNGNTGIAAFSRGNIVLKDFEASGNGGAGVYLNNTYGAASNITVGTTRLNYRNYLDYNFNSGMEILTNGTVMLSNLYAYGNGYDDPDPGDSPYGYGLLVDNSTASTPKNVTLLGSNSFDENYDGGVYVTTKGTILANNITADWNRAGMGAFFDNNTNAALPQNVTLNGTNEFSNNVGSGLEITTFGAITLNNITAEENSANGVYLDNATGATQVRGVTLKGYADIYNNGTFNSGFAGLTVLSRGAILIANLDAWNNDSGVYLDNYVPGVAASPVTVTGHTWASSSNSTNGGYGYGLYIETLGAITLASLDASNNAGFGARLSNQFTGSLGKVLITGYADVYDNGSSSTGYGLYITSRGAITLANLYASGNANFGAELDNQIPGSVGTVTITGYAEASENGEGGLFIYTNRAITLANVYASENGYAGVLLDNTGSGNASPQNVTLSGYNGFYGNGDTGLVVSTYGAITLSNVSANGNGINAGSFGWGAYLDNSCVDLGSGCTATQVRGITLNGVNNFYNNYQDGLWATSLGIIKANNLTASGNGGAGAHLDNQWEVGYYGVTLTGSNTFEVNGDDGLDLWSNGAVTIGNLTANYNNGDGAYIDTYNDLTAPGGKVTLTGNNTFIGNGDGITGPSGDPGTGLVVYADSVVTINNLTANQNTQEGAVIIAHDGWLSWGPYPLNLTLTGVSTFNDNGLDGLYFQAEGNVSITKITADNNGGSGVVGVVEGNITIACGSMTDNNAYGWSLDSTGVVTLKGVFSYGNGANANPAGGTFVYARTCPLP